MCVSVVVCEHSPDRYDDLQDAAESVLAQTYDDVELILVADGNEAVCECFHEDYGDRDNVRIRCNEQNIGLLESRNEGAREASGEVVAYLDDDAIAADTWVEELVEVYENYDVPAVGGKMTPAWIAGKPKFLPEEFYWLVGVTHRGFADGPGEVRNTFGSNISFKREVFLDLGGFETEIGGRQGDANLQGGETELCARLKSEYGYGVYYNPDAEVAHKVFEYRTELSWLLNRAFWQGYSKRGMKTLVPDVESGEKESKFLRQLLTRFLPTRLKDLFVRPTITEFEQFAVCLILTGTVGAGYLYGITRW